MTDPVKVINYEKIRPSDELHQGDLIDKIKVRITNPDQRSRKYTINAMIITQTCSIENKPDCPILLCERLSVEKALELDPTLKKRIDNIIGRKVFREYYLFDCKEVGLTKAQLVFFDRIHMVTRSYLIQHIMKQRQIIRLKPPLREHFSQAFAYYYMRVAVDFDQDKKTEQAEAR